MVAWSIADMAGLKPGDEFVSLAGQPPLSIADVAWVLHRAPASGTLPALVVRNGAEKSLNIVLPPKWREKSDISKRVGTWDDDDGDAIEEAIEREKG